MGEELSAELRRLVEVEVRGGCHSEGEVLEGFRARFGWDLQKEAQLALVMPYARQLLEEQDSSSRSPR